MPSVNTRSFMEGVAEVAREHAPRSRRCGEGTGVINADDEFSGYWRRPLAQAFRDSSLEKPAQGRSSQHQRIVPH